MTFLDRLDPVFCAVASTAVIRHFILSLLQNGKPKDLAEAARVGEIIIYPVKACQGVKVDRVECTPKGFKVGRIRDRNWVFVDKTGVWLRKRLEPRLALINIKLGEDHIVLEAKGYPPLKVMVEPDKNAAILNAIVLGDLQEGCDCGSEAAQWADKFFGHEGTKLMCIGPDTKPCAMMDSKREFHDRALPTDVISYQDLAGFMVLSDSSLKDLAGRIKTPKATVSLGNFRPNIVATDCAPYAEDSWKTLHIGSSVQMWQIIQCARCAVTTIDPSTAERLPEGEPLRTLRSYRNQNPEIFGISPLFGNYFNLLRPGIIRVGDVIYASKDSPRGFLM